MIVWCVFVFITGLMIGSFINVLVARLPYEKSIIWPSSRCFSCYRPIRRLDNLPLIGYLRLRGRCRWCGARFSIRYLWVELGTGISFLTLFISEVIFNWFRLPGIPWRPVGLDPGLPSGAAIAVFAYHAFLLSGLIAAAVIDAEHRIIPPQITYTGLAVGVLGGVLMPWPWPHAPEAAQQIPAGMAWFLEECVGKIPLGLQPWPFWGPTFEAIPPGSWKMGLLNALMGALAGSLVVRAVKWLFETGLGREALGLGDADLLMMAGAFLGWQIAVLSLFVGSFAALVLKIVEWAIQGTGAPVASGPAVGGPMAPRELPFGPGLAVGVVLTWFGWPWLAPRLQFPFFDAQMMGILVAMMGVGLLAAALLLRRSPAPEPAAK